MSTASADGAAERAAITAATEELAGLKWRGESDVALARIPALLDRARRMGDREIEKRLRIEAVPNLLELGLYERAAVDGGALLADPLVADDPRARASVGAMVADAWARLGRVNEAMAVLAGAIGVARTLPTDTEHRIGAVHNVATCALQCGLFEAAEPLFARVAEALGPDLPLRAVTAFEGNRAVLHLEWGLTLEHAGRADAARPHYATALDVTEGILTRHPLGMVRMFAHAQGAVLEAKLGRADAADARLADVDVDVVDTQTSLNHRMIAQLARACTDLGLGRLRTATDAGERAAALAERVHNRRCGAEAWRIVAAARRAHGDDDAAADAVERAGALVDAVAWDDRVYGAALTAATAG